MIQTTDTKQGGFSIWPVIIISLLGLNMTICAITVYAATRNPAAVTVEPDYYRKAVEWDSSRQIWSKPEEAGWDLTASARIEDDRGLIHLMISGRASQVGLHALVFHRLQPDVRTEIMLVRTGVDEDSSVYSGVLPSTRIGLWDLEIRDESEHVRFVRTVELIAPSTGD
jgi:hypothetical protein